MRHPITLGVILIFYSLILRIISIILSRSWIFYLLILVFLGGVIILIIYIRTLSANEKFSNKNNTNIIFIIIFLLTILLNSNFINNSFIFINYNFINHLYSFLNISSTMF